MYNTIQTYPIIIIPDSIKNALIEPEKPSNTIQPIVSFIKERLIIGLIGVTIIIVGLIVGNGIPIIIGIVILVFQFLAIKNYKLQKKVYQKSVEEYEKFKLSRNQAYDNYSYLKNSDKNNFNIDLYFKEKLEVAAQTLIKPKYTTAKCKVGLSEKKFKKYLSNFMEIEIDENQYEVEFFNITYYPDIVLAVKVGNSTVYIDIEIDEPYSLDLQPIHFIGCDKVRNETFVKNNWIVVRFAEEQVVKYPERCCELIRSIYKHLLSGGIYEILEDEEIKISHWSFIQSKKMMHDNYRYSYLPLAEEIKASFE